MLQHKRTLEFSSRMYFFFWFCMIFGRKGYCFPKQNELIGLKAAMKLVYSKLIIFI